MKVFLKIATITLFMQSSTQLFQFSTKYFDTENIHFSNNCCRGYFHRYEAVK